MGGIELGLIFAGVTALAKGVQNVFQKRGVIDTDEFVTGWSSRFFALLILIPLVIYQGLPTITLDVILLVIIPGLAITATSVLIARAYRLSDISLVTPVFAFSPALLLLTSPVMIGEMPSPKGIAGVLMISFGAYFLKIDERKNLLEPFKAFLRDRGVQLAFIVILIYSITANIDKIGVEMSSPIFWALSTHLVSSFFLFPLMVEKTDNWISEVKSSWKDLLIIGLLGGVSIAFQMTAVKLTLVSYVIAIKRLSIPLAVVLGYLVFKEENIRGRLFGSLIIVLGAILISI